MGQMSCWVCGQSSVAEHWSVMDADRGLESFQLELCGACCSGRILNPPDDQVLGEYYDGSYYGQGSGKFAAPLQWLVDMATRRLARSIWKGWDRPLSPTVLDIGCGRGSLLAALGELGARGIGLERTPLDSAGVDSSIEIRVGELREQAFPDAGLDAVVLWHVLEHLADPRATLEEVHRILKPGAMLHVAVPNSASWQARCFGRSWFHVDAPRHLHCFGMDGLRGLLQRQGYEIVHAATFDLVQNLFGFIQSALNLCFRRRPNRLYQLMRSAQSPSRVLELVLWLVPAALLLPFALVETALATADGRGACCILFARKR